MDIGGPKSNQMDNRGSDEMICSNSNIDQQDSVAVLNQVSENQMDNRGSDEIICLNSHIDHDDISTERSKKKKNNKLRRKT